MEKNQICLLFSTYLGLLLAVEEADPGGEELFFSDLRLKSNVSVLLGTLSSALTARKSRIRVSYLYPGNSSRISKYLYNPPKKVL